jgi:hypothetical protein
MVTYAIEKSGVRKLMTMRMFMSRRRGRMDIPYLICSYGAKEGGGVINCDETYTLHFEVSSQSHWQNVLDRDRCVRRGKYVSREAAYRKLGISEMTLYETLLCFRC